ncbi:MAG: hypothetical protein WCL50_02035 [Spirochaetota bacterium]
MQPLLSDFANGTILAALAAGLSCLLALVGFGRSYYLAVFLPVSMLLYILTAWLLYLRDDRFLGSPSAQRGKPAAKDPGPDRDSPDGADADAAPRLLLHIAARWDEAPLTRPAEVAEARLSDQPGIFSTRARKALLWAAAELGLVASLLYAIWGIGRSYGP